MAYCVNCGVKLESGATVCPLCKTVVQAPPEIIGQAREPLFPPVHDAHAIDRPMLDKNRKGIIELVIAFMGIAVITLFITAFAIAHFSPWLPVGCVILGGSYLLVALFVRPTYTRIATWFATITVLLLVVIDVQDLRFTWSIYANLSILLYWIVGVAPLMTSRRKQPYAFLVAAASVAAFLVAIDAIAGLPLGWSVRIGLPTYAVALVALGVLVLRIRYGKPTITDKVLSLIAICSLAVVAGDFFHLRSIGSPSVLTWSSSVAIVAVCIMIFLLLNLMVRRVRHFFNNRVV